MGLLTKVLKMGRRTVHSPNPGFMGDVRIFQIAHEGAPMPTDDSLVEVLDNTASARPDWFEYWPIRNFLLSQALDESTVYGFLSPSFCEKTNLDMGQVLRFIESSTDADVYLFSPFPCHGAFFLNVFEHGRFFDPASFGIASRFFAGIDPSVRLDSLVNHSGNLVLSNYFLAKPVFWRAWLRLGEALFEAAEACTAGIGLRSTVGYRKENAAVPTVIERKVFLMERLVCYLLASTQAHRALSFPIEKMPLSAAASAFATEVTAMDRLKRAYALKREQALLEDYRRRQMPIVEQCWPGGFLSELQPD